MNDEIIHLGDFTKNRETLSRRPIRCMSIFVYLITAFFVVFLIGASQMKLDISITTIGTTTMAKTPWTYVLDVPGVIGEVYVESGMMISKGDKILSLVDETGQVLEEPCAEFRGTVAIRDDLYAGVKVDSGKKLFRVIPKEGQKAVSIYLSDADYVRVKEGETVRVMFPTFSKLGSFQGTIQSLSNLRVYSKDGSSGYRGTVVIDEEVVLPEASSGDAWPIDMPARVIVLIGQETALHKILRIMQVISE